MRAATVLTGCTHGAAAGNEAQSGPSVAPIGAGGSASAALVQQRTTAPQCAPTSLHIAVGTLSPMTQERGILVIVRNTGTAACSIGGYPAITLAEASKPLPFAFKCSGGQDVTGQPPAPVKLPAGGLGYFVVAVQECTTGSGPAPDAARIEPPNGTSQQLAVSAGPGVATPSVCTTRASTLHVSPLVANIRSTYP